VAGWTHFKAQRKQRDAIKTYERAVASIRGDILTANRDLQLDFRDAVDPIYRELAELRIGTLRYHQSSPIIVLELSFALSTIDALKLAELQNYFGMMLLAQP